MNDAIKLLDEVGERPWQPGLLSYNYVLEAKDADWKAEKMRQLKEWEALSYTHQRYRNANDKQNRAKAYRNRVAKRRRNKKSR